MRRECRGAAADWPGTPASFLAERDLWNGDSGQEDGLVVGELCVRCRPGAHSRWHARCSGARAEELIDVPRVRPDRVRGGCRDVQSGVVTVELPAELGRW